MVAIEGEVFALLSERYVTCGATFDLVELGFSALLKAFVSVVRVDQGMLAFSFVILCLLVN